MDRKFRFCLGKSLVVSLNDLTNHRLALTNTVIDTFPGVYKKNPSTSDLHVKCNLTSDIMPKIQPQTKVLIIKIKSAAEVADIFRVFKCQVARIKKDLKKLVTFMTSPGQSGPIKQLFEKTVVASAFQGQPFFNCSRAT